ncbi:19628_t:CDS:2 [Funneliformis geosporum]|uniref:19628_t:CDS:1 n=1 Tax=Funneliformis geosporum TaxID=1117311 RepID=A0A9W4SSE3_9GLOM|nr:19628_t:CDS:2 [Funneliformis geosporum]
MLLQSGSSLDAPTLNELNGLCKPVKYFKSSKNFKNNNIYGVLPFIAPEVLRGQPYTLSSDIFSFSMIMWEFISGILPFNNEAYNFQLSLDINKGKRPEIIEDTPQCYINLMKRCWDMNSLKRPTALEIFIHDGDAKITDFGISKNMNTQNSTIHYETFGRIPYVDPEKLKDLNFQYEKASDIYSYGVLMWEISSGFSPFKNLTSQNDQALLRIRISGGHHEVEMSESDNEPENDLPLDDL